MSWPIASHFSAMLQNPRIAFRDPRLQRSAIEKNEQNQPKPWAGAFAVVYKGVDPEGQIPFAVRIFTTESPERRERYDLISAYLQGRKLNCLVDFEYRDRSIRSAGDGKWYPVIIMEWVQGETLFQWLRSRALEGNRDAIAKVADRWLEAIRELSDNSVAHCDLQHANVMVNSAWQLKLVDYDGMCVPGLLGRQNLEVGMPPYQHPGRNGTTLLSPNLDDFSALLVYVALRALAAEPALWQKYVDGPRYDKLLFRAEDFPEPDTSPLYHDLRQSADREVRQLAERLFAAARGPLEQTPALGQLLRGTREKEAAKRLNKLLTALRMEDRELFLEWFDARIVRQHAQLFEPHHALLLAWVGELVRQSDRLRLAHAVGRASLWQERQSPSKAFARWSWPRMRFVERCRLAFCPQQPGENARPGEVEIHDELLVDGRQTEREGGYLSLRIEPPWERDYVVVWAEIDIGIQAFSSPPLVLGRLGDCPRTAADRRGLLARLRDAFAPIVSRYREVKQL